MIALRSSATRLSKQTYGAVLFAALFSASACATEIDGEMSPALDEEFHNVSPVAGDGTENDDGYRYLGTTRMQYEGSCNFLLECSAYSDGEVHFGCGFDGCTMDDYWVAAPDWRTYLCGDEVRLCAKGRCVMATVKDVSCCGRWEASHAVLAALDVPHASNPNTCSGYGEVRTSIYVP